MADRLGQQFGNYRLIALLGQGSYAEMYLAQISSQPAIQYDGMAVLPGRQIRDQKEISVNVISLSPLLQVL